MKKYIGGRASGKTYQLIQEARENNGLVIVRDKNQADALKHEYPDMKEKILTFEQYMFTILLSGNDVEYELYIDDFDEIAADYIPGTVMAGTINVEGNIFMFSKGR